MYNLVRAGGGAGNLKSFICMPGIARKKKIRIFFSL